MNKDTSEIAKLTERISKDPKSKLFVPLAEEYKKAGDIEMSIHVLQEGIKNNPGYVTARSFLGRLLIEKGELPAAQKEFEEVVKAIPDNLMAHRKLGDIYALQDRRADALTHYKTVLSLNPKDAETAMLIAEAETGRDIKRHLPKPKPADELQRKQEAAQSGAVSSAAKLQSHAAPAVSKPPEPLQPAAAAEEEAEEVLVVEPLDAPAAAARSGSLEQELAANNLGFLAEPAHEPVAGEGKGEAFDPFAFGDPFGAGSSARKTPEDASSLIGTEPEKQADDFTTDTLAELYISQGFYEKAIDIYERMLVDKPNSQGLKDKLAKVRAMAAAAPGEETKPDSMSFSIPAGPDADFGGVEFDAFVPPAQPTPVRGDEADLPPVTPIPVLDEDVPAPAQDNRNYFDAGFEPREYVPPDAMLRTTEKAGSPTAGLGGIIHEAGQQKTAHPRKSPTSKQQTIERLEGWLKNIMKES